MCWNHSHGEPARQAWLGQERGGGPGLRSWLGLVLVWCPMSLGQPPALSLCPPKCAPEVIMLAPQPTIRRTRFNRVHKIQAEAGSRENSSNIHGYWRDDGGRKNQREAFPSGKQEECGVTRGEVSKWVEREAGVGGVSSRRGSGWLRDGKKRREIRFLSGFRL